MGLDGGQIGGETDLQGEAPIAVVPSILNINLQARCSCYLDGGLYLLFPSLLFFPACMITIDKAWRVPKQKMQLDSFSQGVPKGIPQALLFIHLGPGASPQGGTTVTEQLDTSRP